MSASAPNQSGPTPTIMARLRYWLDFGWIDPAQARVDFQLQTQKDLRGDRIHAALAFVWGVLVMGPISLAEVAIAFPGICWAIRLFTVPRAPRWFFLQPTFVALVLWALWHLIALSWAPSTQAGWKQVQLLRFALPMIALYPILHRRNTIVAGLAVGLALGNLTQLINWIGVRHDVPWLVIKPFAENNRNAGWWPVVAGSEHLVVALGLHVPVLIMGRGKWRLLALLGTAITVAGLIATGARGSWIAGGLLALLILVVAIWRIPNSSRRLAFGSGALAAVVAMAGLVWFSAGDRIAARFSQSLDEIPRAFQHRDFMKADGSRVGDDSSRVAMAVWAVDAIRENPVLGLGTGGYATYVRTTKQADGPVYDDFVARNHQYCHNAVLNEWATTGTVGLVLMLAIVFTIIWSACTTLTRESLGTYAAGPAFALIGFCMLWPFEVIQSNATTIKVLLALVALSPSWYPNSPSEARAQARASQ